MAKYKVKVNPKTPSEKDIIKSQDFNDVLKQASSKKYNLNHVRKKMHSKPRFILWFVFGLSVLLALLVSIDFL